MFVIDTCFKIGKVKKVLKVFFDPHSWTHKLNCYANPSSLFLYLPGVNPKVEHPLSDKEKDLKFDT